MSSVLKQLQAHDVPPPWRVEDLQVVLPAADVADARLQGIQEAHRRAGVPPWKPCIRSSWPRASATRVRS